jgi:hypothetical protein
METKGLIRRNVDAFKQALAPTRKKAQVATMLVADLFAGPVVKIYKAAKQLADEDLRQRLTLFASYLRTVDEPGEFGSTTVEEAFVVQLIKAMLEDEEADKVWAYATLVRAFAAGKIAPEQRMRCVRLVRDSLNAELIAFIDLGPEVSGVRLALTAVNGPCEHQAMLRVMQRWGVLPDVGSRIGSGDDPPLFKSLMAVLREGIDRKRDAG